ncbi:PaaI family thioesterase, partial [Flavobacteriaceae bacterium]|nr:PaaI family thioesterase [Flavobacteriaceae bacterium]
MDKTSVDFEKYLNFHKEYGGTGKLYKFKFLEYKKGFLKLEAEFSAMTLNPNQSVQGGQMNSMLDDVTSLLVIYESKGDYYPSSTNLHSIHHRPLFAGKVIATAEVIKV